MPMLRYSSLRAFVEPFLWVREVHAVMIALHLTAQEFSVPNPPGWKNRWPVPMPVSGCDVRGAGRPFLKATILLTPP
jgi:hypothetical protein